MKKKNTLPIRVDADIFIPEMIKFKEKNGLEEGYPSLTREIGKLMQELRIKQYKIKKVEEIKF